MASLTHFRFEIDCASGYQDGAKKALQLAKSYAPNAEAKWGQEGLESILQDKSIHAVAVVLPAQHQVR